MTPRITLWPTQIYSLYDPKWEDRLAMTEHYLLNRLNELASKGDPLDEWNRGLILGYPRAAAGMTQIAEQRQDILNTILSSNTCTLYYLLSDYDRLAERCEERLLGPGMGPYIYHLIEWAQNNRRNLRRPLSYYTGQLLSDPYWALRANRLIRSATYVKELADYCVLHKDDAAGPAFFYLVSSPRTPVDPYQKLFNEDPFYSFLAMHALKERGFTARRVNPKKLTPQWAYHLLLFSSHIPEIECEARVLESPEWTAEYIVSKNYLDTDMPRALKLYFDSVDSVKGQFGRPLDPQLHKWLKRVKQQYNLE